jgi:hypothetical protein
VASCRYYHRSLNPKKLIEVGFSRLAPRMTMARTLKVKKKTKTLEKKIEKKLLEVGFSRLSSLSIWRAR